MILKWALNLDLTGRVLSSVLWFGKYSNGITGYIKGNVFLHELNYCQLIKTERESRNKVQEMHYLFNFPSIYIIYTIIIIC